MATVRITEAELAHQLHEVLEQARQGVEYVIEGDQGPAVLLRSPAPDPRFTSIEERIAFAKAYEARFAALPPDEELEQDVQAGIDARGGAFEPPKWD